jgi:SAM-dependent methyltransferase
MSSHEQVFQRLLEAKARTQYDAAYARTYRDRDEAGREEPSHRDLGEFVNELTRNLPQNARVLDLGCGTGRYFHCIQRSVHLVGLDLSPAMLREARQPMDARRLETSVHLVCGSLFRAPFATQCFDLVYCIGVLGHHLPLTEQILRQVHGWLKPGGLFGFTADDADSPRATSWRHERARQLRRVAPRRLRPWLDSRLHEFGVPQEELERLLRVSPFQESHWWRRHSPTGRIDFVVTATAATA